MVNKVQCKTNTLDHNNVDDYNGGAAVFDDKLTLGTFTPDGGCLSVRLFSIHSKLILCFRLLWMVQCQIVPGTGLGRELGRATVFVLSGLERMFMQ